MRTAFPCAFLRSCARELQRLFPTARSRFGPAKLALLALACPHCRSVQKLNLVTSLKRPKHLRRGLTYFFMVDSTLPVSPLNHAQKPLCNVRDVFRCRWGEQFSRILLAACRSPLAPAAPQGGGQNEAHELLATKTPAFTTQDGDTRRLRNICLFKIAQHFANPGELNSSTNPADCGANLG
jgi:hypothetical protein